MFSLCPLAPSVIDFPFLPLLQGGEFIKRNIYIIPLVLMEVLAPMCICMQKKCNGWNQCF